MRERVREGEREREWVRVCVCNFKMLPVYSVHVCCDVALACVVQMTAELHQFKMSGTLIQKARRKFLSR